MPSMIGHLEYNAVNKQSLFVIVEILLLVKSQFMPADNSTINERLNPLRQLEYEVHCDGERLFRNSDLPVRRV